MRKLGTFWMEPMLERFLKIDSLIQRSKDKNWGKYGIILPAWADILEIQ